MNRHPVRWSGSAVVAAAILAPIGLIVWQSFQSDPFFMPKAHLDLGAWAYVLGDREFWTALGTTAAIAAGMVAISVPFGAVLAFLFVRTDVPGRRWSRNPWI